MTILNLGTFPPKQCGIATFSMDLYNSLSQLGNTVKVMAVSDDNYEYRYPREVIFNLKQNQKQDYIKAANYINGSHHIQLVIIQHEYGIYGGVHGQFILELVKRLHKPYVLVTHTVLPHPDKQQKDILNQLCHRAAGIVCMTRRSADLLSDLYEAPPELVRVIAHGVPEFGVKDQDRLKEKYRLEGRDVISTFGLIGPGKGLELGIKALANVAPRHPQVCYLILGQTHPMLQKTEGEKYRHMLENLVAKLDLPDHVLFVNKYLTTEELGEYLYMSDVYLSPYPNRDQAVSGTMAFAMGCGRAIVSTTYAYAEEVLAGGRGLLAREANSDELSELINRILSDSKLKASLQESALALGKGWSWPCIGQHYTDLFEKILDDHYIQEEEEVTYARL